MNFRVFTLLIALSFGLVVGFTDYYHRENLHISVLIFAFTSVLSFIALFTLFEKFVYKRIRNVYKLIHNLKLGKDLKNALGQQINDDPLADAEREVRDWAKQKASEINKLKEQAQFRKEFLSNISHEFKTPLFATQGYIETLQDGVIEE